MTTVLRCSRCGSHNDVGLCWSYSHEYPEPSGHEHDMKPYVIEAPVMTLEEVIELASQPMDDMWENSEEDDV